MAKHFLKKYVVKAVEMEEEEELVGEGGGRGGKQYGKCQPKAVIFSKI